MIAQNEYWRKHPPVHVLVAAYLGYEATDQDDGGEYTPADLMQMFPLPAGM